MPTHLKINLQEKSIENKEIDNKVIQKYLGGRGLGAYLYSQNPRKAEDKDNSVFIVPGILTGTQFPSSSRSEVVTSSPLTGYYTASSSGGHFGAFLKSNGIAALEITGVSDKWIYIVINEGNVTFKEASDLVGKTTTETRAILKDRFPAQDISIASIGPAGENLVKFTSLMLDKRASGRTGTGWHFGYKKIKAIVVVKSNKTPQPKNPEKTQKVIKELISKKINADKSNSTYCTPSFTEWANEIQAYPASNYQRNFVSDKEIAGLSLKEYQNYTARKEACWNCPIACTRIVISEQGKEVRGPEYESVWALGANCDNFEIRHVIECNRLCDEYSLDTISTGGVLAWYKECVDKGLIDDTWSIDRMKELINEIAYRKGTGEKLADGVVKASENFGVGKRFIAHSKNLELPAWDPRTAIGMSVAYATSPTGGDHCKGWTVGEDTADHKTRFDIEGKVDNVIKSQNNSAVLDSIGTCMFADMMYDEDIWLEVLNAYAGLDLTKDDLTDIGSNIFMLETEINKSLGHTFEENNLPERIIGYEIEVYGEKEKLSQEEFDGMMDEYGGKRFV